MIIIETCPKCGHDLLDSVICTNPPIPKKNVIIVVGLGKGREKKKL